MLFEKHVRPTLIDQCIRCHGEKKQQGGLRLDSREGWMTGGDSGPAIVPGDPDRSLLVNAVRYDNADLEMPPKGVLPEKTIAAIEEWVKLGAIDPRNSDASTLPGDAAPSVEEGREFWSFQSIQSPRIPKVKDQAWPVTNIDRFVLARLEREGIKPVAQADKRTLVRRVYYDLIGLPPTPEQIEKFVADESPNAYANLIDQLLASPHFGERWGRHWLDVVRFAESSGGGRTLLFPNAWRYRDYVIESFNDDIPYDQFIKEQLAGDLVQPQDWRDERRKLTATAYLLLGPTNYELQDKDILEMDVVDEQLDTIGKSMLGMTIGCARCHDHKFDPIPTEDYYALAGILKSTKAMIHSNVSTWNKVELPVSPQEERVYREHETQLAALRDQIKATEKELEKLGGTPKSKQYDGKNRDIDSSKIEGIVIDDAQAELIGEWTSSTSVPRYVDGKYIHDGTAGKGDKKAIYRVKVPEAGKYEVRIGYSPSTNRSTRVPIHVHHAGGEAIVRINQKKTPEIDRAFTSVGVYAFDPKEEIRVVISNEGTEDGVVIADAVVLISSDTSKSTPSKPIDTPKDQAKEKQRKLVEQNIKELNDNLKQLEKDGPKRPVAMVTADDEDAGDIHVAIRGIVHNKGPVVQRGVLQVASSNPRPAIPDGQSGRAELAQWIASRDNPLTSRVMANRIWHWLIGQGIVTSVDNFGSMGAAPTHPELLDYLADTFVEESWSVKSLIRRIMMSRVYRLSSQNDPDLASVDPDNRLLWRMNRKRLRAEDFRDTLLFVGGSLDTDFGGPNITKGTGSEYGYQFKSTRRSVYVPVFRNRLPEIFEVFDFADPNIQRGKRTSSTIASQALLLMNHPFVITQSEKAATRLLETEPKSVSAKIEQAYLQVIGRPPSQRERKISEQFVGNIEDATDDHQRWALLYQSLFECVDFRFLN